MEEWKTYRLGDICATNQYQYSPRENWQTIEYLDTGSITRNEIESTQIITSAEDLPSRARRKVQNLDIIYSTVRPNQCHYGLLRNPAQNLLVSTGFTVLTINQSIANPYYVFYYLTQENITSVLQAIAEQSVSAYPSLKPSDIEDIEINLPTLEVQNRVASILTSMDDKIKLNNRINHNLEEQVQALYKSWFVDFEPFKDGKFVESELGMIPEGWTVVTLNDIAILEKKTINPQKHAEVVFTHYSIPAYDNSEIPEVQRGSDIMSNKFIISDHSVLFSKLNPRIKRVWNVYQAKEHAICSTEFVVYKSKDQNYYPFLFSVISGDGFYNSIMSKVNGATGSHQRFHPEETLEHKLPFNASSYTSYCNIILPIIREIEDNKQENLRLTLLRDSLLPRFMAGELNSYEIDC